MKLFWETETGGAPARHYILKRQTPTIRPFLPRHSHDYAELVYVERGHARHELNSTDTPVGKGDVLFLLPDVVEHCFHDCDAHFSILQILFSSSSYWFVRNRYAEYAGGMFDENTANPLVNLGPTQQLWLERNFDRLLVNDGSLIEIERFLLNFIGLVQESRERSETVPWLDRALHEIQEPKNFRQGASGFVRLCNRSPEHVGREVKKRTGRTITDLVNQVRMQWASYMLIFTDAEISDIAFGCGLESVSHFYRLFREYQGVSPARFRKTADRDDISAGSPTFVPFRGAYFSSDGLLI